MLWKNIWRHHLLLICGYHGRLDTYTTSSGTNLKILLWMHDAVSHLNSLYWCDKIMSAACQCQWIMWKASDYRPASRTNQSSLTRGGTNGPPWTGYGCGDPDGHDLKKVICIFGYISVLRGEGGIQTHHTNAPSAKFPISKCEAIHQYS